MSEFRHAFSLSQEAVAQAVPPGTIKLFDHVTERTTLQYHTREQGCLILVPPPSSDPADPLNWARWRKLAVLAGISIYAFVGNVVSATISSGLAYVARDFPTVSYGGLIHALAVNTLMMGVSNIVWVPLANVFGRRTITLVAVLIMTVSSIWAAKAESFGSLVGARIVQGIGSGASETVSPEIIGDIFFRHQRGRAMAIYTVFLALGPISGGIMGSYIAAHLGWRWTQWLNVILGAVTLLYCLLFQPETIYDRARPPTPDGFQANSTNAEGSRNTEDAGEEKSEVSIDQRVLSDSRTYAPYTFSRSLRVGIYRGNFLAAFLAPWKTLQFPAVWLNMLLYGGLVGGITSTGSVSALFVSMPPYNWGQNAGLVSVGGLIGAVAGVIITFITSDFMVKRQAKRNPGGFSEPESRLPGMALGCILATAGLWTFGFSASTYSPRAWLGLEFGIGMLSFGLTQIPSIGFNYLIESYRSISGDCFVIITSLRAVVGFCWVFFVGSWVESSGYSEPFGIFGMLMGIFSLLTIPIYFWGKRIRIATAHTLARLEESDYHS